VKAGLIFLQETGYFAWQAVQAKRERNMKSGCAAGSDDWNLRARSSAVAMRSSSTVRYVQASYVLESLAIA